MKELRMARECQHSRRLLPWLLMAKLRQCHRQFARRKPAIERGRTRPRLFKLDGDLDRQLLAGLRQWYRALARRNPAVERGQDRLRLFKLEVDLDRQLMAGRVRSLMAAIRKPLRQLWVGSTYLPDEAAAVRVHQALNGRSSPNCSLTPADGPTAGLAEQPSHAHGNRQPVAKTAAPGIEKLNEAQ